MREKYLSLKAIFERKVGLNAWNYFISKINPDQQKSFGPCPFPDRGLKYS